VLRHLRLLTAGLALVLVACSPGAATGRSAAPTPTPTPTSTRTPTTSALGTPAPRPSPPPLTAIPPLLDPHDVYAADRPGKLSREAAQALPLVYVPDHDDGTVHVIDPATYRVVRVAKAGRSPQHVTPSWDLRTLWVTDDTGSTLTPINPRTGRFAPPVPVTDAYNLYFTADGRRAVVVAERLRRLDFRDPRTMELKHTLPVPCAGIDHADFTRDGTHALFSCEFSGQMVFVDMVHERVRKVLSLPRQTNQRPKPQDVKLSPDGTLFYVADESSNGVHLVDAATLEVVRFLPTGLGAHGLYVSRDSKDLYITNRKGASVSVLSFATRRVRATWPVPGGSPDMGGVSADGKVLWLSGRYNREVYALHIPDGRLLARIRVGGQPHGLCIWPQPGRYSLGHTGVLR
jgi:YVTN family beta-propeller protein